MKLVNTSNVLLNPPILADYTQIRRNRLKFMRSFQIPTFLLEFILCHSEVLLSSSTMMPNHDMGIICMWDLGGS